MKPHSLQQEILLITTSQIPPHQLAGNHSFKDNQQLSYTEQLEDACRKGLLDQLLPGTIDESPTGNKLQLWQIRSCSRFLHIELCTFPIVIEKRYSVDPYLFLALMNAN